MTTYQRAQEPLSNASRIGMTQREGFEPTNPKETGARSPRDHSPVNDPANPGSRLLVQKKEAVGKR